MNADSGSADYRLTYVPPKKYPPGAMRPVYTFNLSYPRFVGYGRGELFHPATPESPVYEPCGHIPEVESTYGYYEGAEPLLNDEGLGFGVLRRHAGEQVPRRRRRHQGRAGRHAGHADDDDAPSREVCDRPVRS